MDITNDFFERTYFASIKMLSKISIFLRVGLLRFRKFLALPYCYFKFIDWNECKASRFQVVKDFLYIFFKLKYYPENYGYCRFWEKKREDWKYYYGSNYDAYQSYRLEKEVQRKEYRILFDDKELCSQICSALGFSIPKVIDVLDPCEDYVSRLKAVLSSGQQKRLIIKPTRGRGGSGVQLVFIDDKGSIQIRRRNDTINLDDLEITERYLVQEFVEQDEELSRLSSSASIRLTTMLASNEEILFLNCDINTAINNSFISNWSAGGISIGVEPKTGLLKEVGYDKSGRTYLEHPTSKIRFAEYRIPKWEEVLKLATRIQKTFHYYKILGLDVTLSKDGPVLYEINSTPDVGASEQTNGPLLANVEIREEFKRYNLLINNLFQSD